MKGNIHSFQTMGTLDGPGVRFVAFLQGCPLRCAWCHNPDTWATWEGERYPAEIVFEKIKRYRNYFGKDGGVTLSGGEPLLQAEFATELFKMCKTEGIHTALDTSGALRGPLIEQLLSVTDLVLLDFKMTNEQDYFRYTKMHMVDAERFLETAARHGCDIWIRQVVLPGINDTEENIIKLCEKVCSYPQVKRIELLPFRKLCLEKYQKMRIPFPFASVNEPDLEQMEQLKRIARIYSEMICEKRLPPVIT